MCGVAVFAVGGFVSICNRRRGLWAPAVTGRDTFSGDSIMSQSVTSVTDFAELLLQIEFFLKGDLNVSICNG